MKKLLTIAALSLFTFSVFSLSWNGILDDNTKFSTTGFKDLVLDQSNGVYLSVNVPINSTLRFSGEGLYKYNLHVTDKATKLLNTADVDLLKLSGVWKTGTSNFALDAGRFSISDLSGAIFSQASDGVNVKYETAKWKVGFYGGYTGLLNSLNVSMTDTLAESANKDFYALSAAYIPLGVNYAYTSFLGSNVLGAQAFYFKGISKDLKDKLYGTVSLSGPVSTTGSYSTAVVAGLNNYKDFMLYAKADYSAFLGTKGMVGAGVEYASGKQGGLSNFVSITLKPASSTGIATSGVIIPKVNAMYVSNKLFACVNEKIIISIPAEKADLAGSDTTATVLYNLFSDLQVGCDANLFLAKESKNNKLSVTAKASLAF